LTQPAGVAASGRALWYRRRVHSSFFARNIRPTQLMAGPKPALGALALFALLSSGCGLFTRPADVYYRAGWMITHLNDASFPPKSNLCMETFCTRTDTVKKFAGGHRGYTSQAYYRYCPLHTPGFVNTNSRLDGFLRFCYWIMTYFVGWFYAIGVLMLPVWLIAKGAGKAAPAVKDKAERLLDQAIGPTVTIAAVINTTAWLMFAIW
jgi:hypothetical protein